MKKRTLLKNISASLLVVAMLSGCGSTSDTTETNNTNGSSSNNTLDSNISISFDAKVADQGALVCSENGVAKQYTLGSTNAKGTISDFRFFVSEVKLKMSDGSTQELKLENNSNQYYNETNGSVAILDFEDNTGDCQGRGNDVAMNKSIVGTINTTATVEGIEFTIGVPEKLNHTEFVDIPALTKTSMAWSWASGRKFTKLETNPVDDLNATGDIFNFHLGSTGCGASVGGAISCTQPNRVHIVFYSFDPKTQKIVLDYAQLLAHTDITVDAGGAKGCMSSLADPECVVSGGKMFAMIGLDDADQKGQCLDGDCTVNQKLFSVQPK